MCAILGRRGPRSLGGFEALLAYRYVRSVTSAQRFRTLVPMERIPACVGATVASVFVENAALPSLRPSRGGELQLRFGACCVTLDTLMC